MRLKDVLAHVAMREGRYEDAARHMTDALSPAMRAAGGVEVIELIYAALGDPSRNRTAVAALRALESTLPAEDLDWMASHRLLIWYTLLGAVDLAHDVAKRSLDRFMQSGTVGSGWGIVWMPEMHPFRRDPRFQQLVSQLGLVTYWQQYGPPDGCELREGKVVCP